MLLFFFICLISSLKEIEVKKYSLTKNRTGVIWHPSQGLYQLSYCNIVTRKVINLTLKFQKPRRRPRPSPGSSFTHMAIAKDDDMRCFGLMNVEERISKPCYLQKR